MWPREFAQDTAENCKSKGWVRCWIGFRFNSGSTHHTAWVPHWTTIGNQDPFRELDLCRVT